MSPKKIAYVIDDDDSLLDSTKFWLNGEGYTCLTFKTAEAFLQHGNTPTEGVLIIDHLLPGMLGLDLLRKLRSEGITVPAVVITTYPSAALLEEVDQLNARVIEKPLMSATFHKTIEALLS